MPDVRGCIDYVRNGCQDPAHCMRAIAARDGNPTELVNPDYWPATGECNCRIETPTIQDERDELAENNREKYRETKT